MLTRRENLLIRPWQKRRYIYHREKVETALPAIDNTSPPHRPHVSCKLKKMQKEAERCSQVVSDNFTLLQHLSNIMRSTRVDHFWEEPPPNFLQRVGIYKIREKPYKTIKLDTSEDERPKTRKERCAGCSPERFAKINIIPEARIPFPTPKKRVTRKAETPPEWETQYRFRCSEDRPEFRGKVWKKPDKRISLRQLDTEKRRRRFRRKRELLEEPQSLYLSKGGLTLAVKFPSRTEVLMSNQRGTRVIERELCECKSFPKKFSQLRKSTSETLMLRSPEKLTLIELEKQIEDETLIRNEKEVVSEKFEETDKEEDEGKFSEDSLNVEHDLGETEDGVSTLENEENLELIHDKENLHETTIESFISEEEAYVNGEEFGSCSDEVVKEEEVSEEVGEEEEEVQESELESEIEITLADKKIETAVEESDQETSEGPSQEMDKEESDIEIQIKNQSEQGSYDSERQENSLKDNSDESDQKDKEVYNQPIADNVEFEKNEGNLSSIEAKETSELEESINEEDKTEDESGIEAELKEHSSPEEENEEQMEEGEISPVDTHSMTENETILKALNLDSIQENIGEEFEEETINEQLQENFDQEIEKLFKDTENVISKLNEDKWLEELDADIAAAGKKSEDSIEEILEENILNT